MDLPITTVLEHFLLTRHQTEVFLCILYSQQPKEYYPSLPDEEGGTRDYICLTYKPMFLTPAQTALPKSFVASRG